MIKELYHQIKLRAIHMDIKVKNILIILKIFKMIKNNDWPFRMIIIEPSGSGKINTILHLINNFHPIDKIYLYAKDTDEKKYQFLINKRKQAGLKNSNDPHAFIEHSNDMNDVFDNIDDYNKNRDKKILVIFDDMIADTMRSEKFKAIVK